ncbi:MAG: metalloregulator ArsR/SmtB family transcription factor [Actinomycetota bacterium]|nr:metalloregulator ArsR/SmtB family transcription factor [Actinomycetota bacterium]
MEALDVLADPTRRRIVELLSERERNAGELAREFRISRPGVSRHLRVLRESGLVRARERGTERVYSLDPRPLEELDEWLDRCRGMWQNRLDALETELRRAQRQGGAP